MVRKLSHSSTMSQLIAFFGDPLIITTTVIGVVASVFTFIVLKLNPLDPPRKPRHRHS